MNSRHLAAYVTGHAQTNPGHTAIHSHRSVLSYAGLEAESNRAANFFEEKIFRHSPEDDRNPYVCVILNRSAEIIITLTGLLKAGLVFVPVSPDIPEKRIQLLLEETKTKWVVTSPEYREKFQSLFSGRQLNIVTIDDFQHQPPELQFPLRYNKYAYIYFTSGSTGVPKGVLGRHKSLHHFIHWEVNEFNIDDSFRFSQLTPPTFDPYLRDILTPLMAGATICIPSYDTMMNPAELIRWIDENKIRFIHTVPSLFKLISHELENDSHFTHLKYILLAGELLRGNDIRKFLDIFKQRIQLVNIYGPTETTLAKFFYRIQPGDAEKFIIPVGKTIKGAEAFILDEEKKKCLTGNSGEIYIRTPYISSGYFNNKALNKKVFIKNPFSNEKNDYIYKTGDMGRRLFDGNVELVGRVDGQIKIRGNRVETGEIENLLLNIDYIKEAVVVDKDDQKGEKYLCAYLVLQNTAKKPASKQTPLDITSLKRMLAEHLPAHMLPSYFIPLEAMPLNPNGKVNRKALPQPQFTPLTGSTYTPPQTGVEKSLVKIWKDVLALPLDSIGIDDNFFDLGGHSLKAVSVISKIHKQLNVQVPLGEIFKSTTIRELARFLDREKQESFEAIAPVEKREYYALSSGQKRLYFLQQMEPANTAYNIPVSILLDQDVIVEKLEQTFKRLIQRHENLRTSFHMLNDTPVQKIHDHVPFHIEDIRDNEAGIQAFIRPHDLTRPPLMRVGLVRKPGSQSLLKVDVHHIITDGVSQMVLRRDFMALYMQQDLPPLYIQYKDFSQWRNRNKTIEKLQRQENYWLSQFDDQVPLSNIPTDFPRPAVRSFDGSAVQFRVDPQSTKDIMQLARDRRVTLYMLLLAVIDVLLAKLSGLEDIVVGTTAAGRTHADLEKIIGMFVNTLPLRNYPQGEKPFTTFLEDVKNRTLEAFENQEYQFEDLVNKVAVERDMGRNPLFDVMFVLQNIDIFNQTDLENQPPTGQDAPQEVFDETNRVAKFDLTITVWEMQGELKISFQYCTKLFKKETIQRFITYFQQIIAKALENPQQKISQIEIISPEEKSRILDQFNNNAAGYPREKTIHCLFQQQAQRTPHRIALACSHLQISYGELDGKSGMIARELRQKGVQSETIVAVKMERRAEMIIAIIAILKAGGAYLPIDPELPAERETFIMNDSAARVMVTSTCPGNGKNNGCIEISAPAGTQPVQPPSTLPSPSPSNIAYIIYTSGTTGKPKGVLVEHHNIVRLLINDKSRFDFNDSDIWTMFHSFNFDFSVWEMYGSLLYGGRLILVPKMVSRDPAEFLLLLKRHRVTILNQTPSAFYNLIKAELKSPARELDIRCVIFGGEALKPVKLKEWKQKYPDVKLINMFGITETTVHVTYKEIDRYEIEHNISNIGVPIPTMTAYVVDKHLNLQPPGAPGELLVGWEGVSRGYLNRPQLTHEKFLSGLFHDRERIYRSGDLARLLPNNELEYLGRIDHQVQLKGFRIELGEIENRLLQFPDITEALVMPKDSGGDEHMYLCAYLVTDTHIDTAEIRQFLAQKLPDYMIPRAFVAMKEFPLTANGKIHRAKLPEPQISGLQNQYTAPTNETQGKMVQIWQQVLQADTVGIKDNYFQLGGDSIKAIALISAINNEFQSNLKIADLYTNQTLDALASILDRQSGQDPQTGPSRARLTAQVEELKNTVMETISDPDNVGDVFPMSDIEKGMVFHYIKDAQLGIYNNQSLYQVVFEDFDVQRLKKAFSLLMEKHPILRTAYIDSLFAHVVYKEVPVNVLYYDISHMDRAGKEAFVGQRMLESRKNPFDVHVPPLWRMTCFNTGVNNNIIMLWESHHAILDGWSNASLLSELYNTYLQLKDNPGFIPPKLKSGYKEYILQEMTEKENPAILDYWKQELADYKRLNFPEPMELTSTHDDAPTEIKTVFIDLGIQRRAKLEAMAEKYNTSLKHLCFAANALMLNMLSHEKDIVMGLVTNNRPICQDGDKIIGCFLNTIPVRIKFPQQTSWLDFIHFIEKKMVEIKKYDRLSLFEIASHIEENTAGQNQLMDTLFNFVDFYAYEEGLGKSQENDKKEENDQKESGEPGDAIDFEKSEKNNFPFNLNIHATLGRFVASAGYNTAFLSRECFEKMCGYFDVILDHFILHPETLIHKSEIMPAAEKKRLLEEFNNTGAAYPRDKTIYDLFESQVEKHPGRIAVSGGNHPEQNNIQLTYKTLAELSHRLALALRRKGLQSQDIAAIKTERSIHMITGIYGIIKAGAAYLPIAPDYPRERIDYMLEDSSAHILLTEKEIQAFTAMDQRLLQTPLSPPGSHNLAYVIYTSGSTGKPKGTLIEHHSLVNRLNWMQKAYPLDENDTILQKTTFTFDVSVWEIFWWAATGSRLALLEHGGEKDPQTIVHAIKKNVVTTMHFVPSMLSVFLDYLMNNADDAGADAPASLKRVIASGEALAPSHVERFYRLFSTQDPPPLLANLYGPTEATIDVSYFDCPHDVQLDKIPIGKPIDNIQLHVLDKDLQIQPTGVAGELHIAGAGLARGYLNRPELTNRRFADHYLQTQGSSILYKTGDLARWLRDGNIQFLGRIDHQVKIRGFRIELGEIQNALNAIDYIKEAIVMDAKDADGDSFLVAYITAPESPEPTEISARLAKSLPAYMIPSYFIPLESIPLTPNGKVDRKALPKPGFSRQQSYTPPRNQTEKKLVEIWAQVLAGDPDNVSNVSRLMDSIGIETNFFQSGGHSLKAILLASRIHKDLAVQIPLPQLFKAPTIKGLAQYIQTSRPGAFAAIPPIEKKEYYCLSSAQKRLFILHRLEENGTAYNMPYILSLEEQIDIPRLQEALRKVIARHESLRTSFTLIDEEAVQRVFDQAPFEIALFQSPGRGTSTNDIIASFIRPFDLSHAPLIRAGIIREKTRHILMIDMHHIITDGLSQTILLKDFMALYNGKRLPPLHIMYKEYSQWQQSPEIQQLQKQQEQYWREEFAETPEPLNLPFDFPRPATQSFEGDRIHFQLSPQQSKSLGNIARSRDATLFMVLLAAFDIFLAKISASQDIVTGIPIAGRRHADLENIIGLFVNTLALRNFPYAKLSFSSFLQNLREKVIQSFENQDYQFEELVDKVALKKDMSRNPLFDVLFVFQNFVDNPSDNTADSTGSKETGQEENQQLKIKPHGLERKTSKFDLSLYTVEKQDQIHFSMEYCSKLFRPQTIQRFIRYFKKVLDSILEDPHTKISQIQIISQEEKQQILRTFNDTSAHYPDDTTIHELFEAQVEKNPDRIAVTGGGSMRHNNIQLTYRALNELSLRLALALRRKGLQSQDIVAIETERSIEMILGIYGTIKAGGAYLPIAPDYPDERIGYMLKDSNAYLLLSEKEIWEFLTDGQALSPRSTHSPLPPPAPHNLAYVIYTSGSTGKPKGVMIEHHSLLNWLNWMQKTYRLDEHDTILQKTTFTFDVSLREIFWWAIVGARLVLLAHGGEKDSRTIAKTVEKHFITTIHFVPSMLSVFLDYLTDGPDVNVPLSLKRVIASGEALPPSHVERFHRLFSHKAPPILANLYGPTEATVEVSSFDCPHGKELDKIPIGKPIDNIRLYVLDNDLQLQPIGVSGELHIAGAGLARGYLNRPELTNRSFVDYNLQTQGSSTLYKTGDLARWLQDGNIEFLGRIDHQVKIRGFRIELGEIENALNAIDYIKEAVVIDGKDGSGDSYLAAYIVASEPLEPSTLSTILGKSLPQYMIPAYFLSLDQIPLTANGKVNRKALPKPEIQASRGAAYIAPRDAIEKSLAEIWNDILPAVPGPISMEDNFFHLGGHSLRATVMISRIHKTLQVQLPLTQIFKTPTIGGLAQHIRGSAIQSFQSIQAVEKKEYYPLSSAQKRLYIVQQLEPGGTAYNMPQIIPLSETPDVDRFEDTFLRLIRRHESFRTSFHMLDQQPVQVVHEHAAFEIEHYDDAVVKPFDLSRAPLLRAGLINSPRTGHALLVDMHHIISDGISHQVLRTDFMRLFNHEELPPLRIQYKDFSQWQNAAQQQQSRHNQEQWWIDRFSDEIPVLDLPADYQRPTLQSFQGDSLDFRLNPKTTTRLKKAALEQGTTPFMILTAMFNILLAKLSGQEDIVVGTPIAGRRHADLEKVIGMFVNTLALRNQPDGGKTFHQFLEQVKNNTLQAFENQDCQFEDLVEKVAVKRDTSRNPLFDVMFSLNTTGEERGTTEPRREDDAKKDEFENRTVKFDINLTALDSGEDLRFSFQYCTKLFKKTTIRRFVRYFRNIISAGLTHPNKKLSEIEIMSKREKQRVLYDFNRTGADYPKDKTIHGLFREQAEKVPGRIALMGNPEPAPGPAFTQLSYGELDRRAGLLASRMRQNGCQPQSIAAILAPPCLHMTAAILAALKCGACYLPIDPQTPPKRIEYMLKDSQATILLTQSQLDDNIRFEEKIEFEGKILDIGDNLLDSQGGEPLPSEKSASAHDPVYMIYTSGTTGKPKGVLLTHRNLVHYVTWFTGKAHITPEDKTVLTSSFAFDLGYTSLYSSLLNGAGLHIMAKEDYMFSQNLLDYIGRFGITYLKMTPSLFSTIAADEYFTRQRCHSLRLLVLGGEAINTNDVAKAFKVMGGDLQIMNHYGPTEVTIGCIARFIEPKDIKAYAKRPFIGKPIANIKAFILDKGLKPLPPGIAGELCLSGAGVAKGYFKREALTDEKFIPNTLLKKEETAPPHDRIYRTGDLARWGNQGQIEFLGRIDHQLKIRGYRVELGEIENLLPQHENIKEATVIAASGDDGDKYLCAYIVPQRHDAFDGTASMAETIKAWLSLSLPEYMVPAYYVPLPQLPLTPNGKLNRKALPPPEINTNQNYTAPRDTVEEQLAEIWNQILERVQTPIGIDDDFFQLGGHSLRATIMISRIHKALNVHIPLAEVFKTPTIRGLAQYIRGSAIDTHTAIEAVEKREFYPLSSAQKRLYILQQLEPDGSAYNMPKEIRFPQPPEPDKLENAFKKLIQRHESFRTSFHMIGGEPVQVIHENLPFHLEYNDATGFHRPFDLSRAPLLRARYVKSGENGHTVLVDMHHIISDGLSIEILVRDFTALYKGETLPPLRIQYKDFAQWQNSPQEKQRLKEQETWWLDRFSGEIPLLDLPVDYPRPAIQSFDGRTIYTRFSRQSTRRLRAMAAAQGASLYMVLLAVCNVFLNKLCGADDIITGTPVAGRRHADLENIAGMFVSTLAMRNLPQPGKPFTDFLRELKENTLQAFENQEYPFELLIEKAAVQRDAARNPLFDVMFSLDTVPAPPVDVPDSNSTSERQELAKFDLTISSMDDGDDIYFGFTYSTALFKKESILRFIQYFKHGAAAVTACPEQQIGQMDIIPEDEKQRILHDFNVTSNNFTTHTAREYDESQRVEQLFVQQAQKSPDAIALSAYQTGEGKRQHLISLSYKQLDEASSQVAAYLLQKGVTPGTIVALTLERSVEMLAALLGILKAGGAYLPIEPSLPQERKEYMLKDSNAALVLTAPQLSEIISGTHTGAAISLQPGSSQADVSRLAYIIYTSGSTGRPKGVMVEHRNLSAYIFAFFNEFSLTSRDVFLQQASYSFDAFVEEVYPILLSGGKLALPTAHQVLDTELLTAFIENHSVSGISCSPLLLNQLNQTEHISKLKTLRIIISGGDVLKKEYVEKLIGKAMVYNTYGPTETTVCAAYYRCTGEEDSSVPIGKTIANYRLYILDSDSRLQPIGVAGELCIAGKGVTRGYLNNPELTHSQFPLDGAVPGSRYYRTGDRCRWLDDGNIQFLGRIDRQVKIRGYRIETGEIETSLLRHQQVQEAAVLVRETENGDRYLCAYIVCAQNGRIQEETREQFPSVTELKKHLSSFLPAYMTPASFVFLEHMPFTTSGKVDNKALLRYKPQQGRDIFTSTAREYHPPRTPKEIELAEIWKQILPGTLAAISIEDNFFDLGGHSLSATVMVSHIHKALNVRVPLAEVFKTPTIKDLAQYINSSAQSKYAAIEPVEKKEYYSLSSAQKRLYVLQQLAPHSAAYNMPQIIPMDETPDLERFKSTFEALIARHESFRTSFIMHGKKPVQIIHETVPFEIEGFVTDDFHESIRQFIRPFDLSRAPLLRVGLVEHDEAGFLVLVDMHHIISDGISHEILKTDFLQLYTDREPAPLRIQYKDFSEWHNKEKQKDYIKQQEKYWLEQYAGDLPQLDIATDFPRPSVPNFEGGMLRDAIRCDTGHLKTLAKENGATTFMLVLAIFNIFLSKISGQEDIVTGTPVAGRGHADLEPVMGLFVNTLAIRNKLKGESTFKEFLREVAKHSLQAFDNQDYPFDDLVEKLKIDRDGRNPIFDVMFTCREEERPAENPEERNDSGFENTLPGISKFDLYMDVSVGHDLSFAIQYSAELFQRETIETFASVFKQIVSAVLENNDIKLNEIEIESSFLDTDISSVQEELQDLEF